MRQTPYYVFDTDEFSKRAAMIRAALDCKGGRRIPLVFHKGKSVSASQAAGGLRPCGGVQPGRA